MKTAATLAVALLIAAPAGADDARHLLFLSAEASYRPALIGTGYELDGYGGIGWMFAPRGLDNAGPIISIETGKPAIEDGQLSGISAGWRWHPGRVYLTAMAGIEQIEDTRRGLAVIDLWWDDRGWMAQGRAKATRDYTNARLAAGRRFREDGPFYGVELATPDGKGKRAGFHITGQKLPLGLEARTSSGWAWGEDERTDGYYAELSLWRRC